MTKKSEVGFVTEEMETGMSVVEKKALVSTLDSEGTGLSLKGELLSRNLEYTSLSDVTPEEKMIMFNVMNNPAKRLKACINMRLLITDIYMEVIELTQDDGTVEAVPRTILVDVDGVGYACTSKGVFTGVKKLIRSFGEPTWKTPLPIMPVEVPKGDNFILTLTVVK